MANEYKTNGSDIASILRPANGNYAPFDFGYKINGTDFRYIFWYTTNPANHYPYDLGYKYNGTDIRNYFYWSGSPLPTPTPTNTPTPTPTPTPEGPTPTPIPTNTPTPTPTPTTSACDYYELDAEPDAPVIFYYMPCGGGAEQNIVVRAGDFDYVCVAGGTVPYSFGGGFVNYVSSCS